MASACALLLNRYDEAGPVNIGCGEDLPISELASLVREVTDYQGQITWDTTKPDGTPRKLLDVTRLTELGFKPAVELRDGIAATYEWWLNQH